MFIRKVSVFLDATFHSQTVMFNLAIYVLKRDKIFRIKKGYKRENDSSLSGDTVQVTLGDV